MNKKQPNHKIMKMIRSISLLSLFKKPLYWRYLDIRDCALPGASVRNSVCGKGHEEEGSAYAKAGSSLRSPPGNSRASTPRTRVCLLYCFVLSPTPLTLRGAVHHLSLWKRVNLQLQLIKFLGVIVFQPTNSFGSPLEPAWIGFSSHMWLLRPPNCERHEMF